MVNIRKCHENSPRRQTLICGSGKHTNSSCGVQPALNSFNSVLFDGKFLCTLSSGPIAQFCFPTNQPNTRCNPWILCGSQLAKDRPWPGDENGGRCHLSKANCRSAAFRAGAPSSSPFGTNGAVHTSTTSVEYTYNTQYACEYKYKYFNRPFPLCHTFNLLWGSNWRFWLRNTEGC